MPGDPIGDFIALPRDQQLAILQALPPGRQDQLLEAVKIRRSIRPYSGPLPPQGSAVSRFTSAAIAPLKGAVQAFSGTPTEAEKQEGLTSIYDTALRPFERVVEAQIGQVGEAEDLAKQGRYSEAAGHALASVVPLVGPWVADAAQQYYGQLGKGDVAGALGTAAGNAALALSPQITEAGTDLTKRAGGRVLRKGQNILTGGTAPVQKLVDSTRAAIHETQGRELAHQQALRTRADEIAQADSIENAKLEKEHAETQAKETQAELDRREKALAAHDKEAAKVDKANEKVRSARTKDLDKHFRAIQEHKGEEPTSLESGRARTKQELQSHKAAIEAGLKKAAPDVQEGLKVTQRSAKATADSMYAGVRKATGPQTLPDGNVTPAPTVESGRLATAVNAAKGFLRGTEESTKEFNAILSKHPEVEEPEFVMQGGKKFGPETELYKSVRTSKEGLPATGLLSEEHPATFNDLQGYYEETGREMARMRGSATFKGDVYQALKSLHNSLGEMRGELADQAGVGKELTQADAYYSHYIDTFIDHDSPVYKAINATEKDKVISQFTGKDQSGVERLAKYNPDLARQINTFRAYAQEARSISSAKTAPFKAAPVLGPKPTLNPTPEAPEFPPMSLIGKPRTLRLTSGSPIERAAQDIAPPERVPGSKPISPEDVQQVIHDSLVHRIQTAARRGSYISVWPLYEAFRAIWGGRAPELPAMALEAAGTYGSVQALAHLLETPKVANFLSRPTPAQLALVTPDVAAEIAPLVKEAPKMGIKISPVLAAIVAASHPNPQTEWWANQ